MTITFPVDMMAKKIEHKPFVETIENTAALALTAAGTNFAINGEFFYGAGLILLGAALEFYKYWGRKNRYW